MTTNKVIILKLPTMSNGIPEVSREYMDKVKKEFDDAFYGTGVKTVFTPFEYEIVDV